MTMARSSGSRRSVHSHSPAVAQSAQLAQHRKAVDINEIEDNPHILQVMHNKEYESRLDLPFERIIADDAPRREYRRRTGEVKTVLHWGQRKLLLSEIEFLTKYGFDGALVVYAGAAPGTHLKDLIAKFPGMSYVLVDPAPSNNASSADGKITVLQEMFTDALAQRFASKENVLFISDVRSCDWQRQSNAEVEADIKKDMDAQMRWHEIIKPVRSMLKFRLPWHPGKTTYLNGDIYFPVWGPITTTEARLVTSTGLKEYDNTAYEQQLYYFNTITRVARYPHNVVGEGIDYCYDCKGEIEVLRDYLIKVVHRDPSNMDAIDREIGRLSENISRACGKGRTLLSGNLDPEDRKTHIVARQWIEGRPAYEKREKQQPVYSDVALRQMQKMGYQEGGLGAHGSGIVEPVQASSKQNRTGLGFDAKSALFGDDAAPTDNAAAPTQAADAPDAANDAVDDKPAAGESPAV